MPESERMQGLLAELKRIERQQSVLQDAVQNSKTVIAHPRITATPPETPEKPKEPDDKFIPSGEFAHFTTTASLGLDTAMPNE